jgi:thiol-disulfide isomerase/thioredoxin
MSVSKQSPSAIVVTSALIIGLTNRAVAAAESVDPVPRYRLEVGQELIYRGESEFKYESGKHVTSDTWRVWVVSQNPDGGWRLVLRHGSAFSQVRDGEEAGRKKSVPRDPSESVTFAWCDFYPDGRLVGNDSLGFRVQPSRLFPKLPADQVEVDQGWTSKDARMDETATYRMLPATAAGRCTFEMVRTSPMNAIYGSENSAEVTFDLERGFPETIVSESRQTYGFKGAGKGTIELIEVNTRPADWCRNFADETQRFFAARESFERTTRRKDLPPDELKRALEEASAELTKIGGALETPEFRDLVDEQVASREQTLKYVLEEAEERSAVLGKPSDEWTTTDLEGTPHALTDYRGKVVILDFWYRGCGWCIRAMPQVKEIAAHFKDQPVVVFGMNTDRNESDALFVVEKMDLNYANLKATGLPEKYNVHGFPTLVILDQEGVIRDIHVGYSPTLRDEVVQSVKQLLKASP